LDDILGALELKSFHCQAKVLLKNMAKNLATITEFENLIKQLFFLSDGKGTKTGWNGALRARETGDAVFPFGRTKWQGHHMNTLQSEQPRAGTKGKPRSWTYVP